MSLLLNSGIGNECIIQLSLSLQNGELMSKDQLRIISVEHKILCGGEGKGEGGNACCTHCVWWNIIIDRVRHKLHVNSVRYLSFIPRYFDVWKTSDTLMGSIEQRRGLSLPALGCVWHGYKWRNSVGMLSQHNWRKDLLPYAQAERKKNQ
jgi:hypothetical protein